MCEIAALRSERDLSAVRYSQVVLFLVPGIITCILDFSVGWGLSGDFIGDGRNSILEYF